ncbi:MAG: hypothetical protein AAGD28_09935 [Bacteroidota bacterium]
MMDQNLKNIWKSATQDELVKLDQKNLIRDMEKQHLKLEKGIRKRDKLEIGVAIILMPFFLAATFFLSSTLSKVGAFLMLPALGFIIYRLKALRKYEPTAFSESTHDYLNNLKIYYTMQRDLLKEVAYWYLIPPFICISMIYWGISSTPAEKVLNIGVAAVIYIGIYFLNQSAVKKKLDPFLEDIDQELKSWEEND